MKKIYQWFLMGSLMILTFYLGITTYAESKTSQAGITFTGDGSIEVSVILQKKDKDTNELLSDATFELLDESGELVKVDQPLTTDEKGEIRLTRLIPGNYTFVETNSPKGYQLDRTPIPFRVDFSQTSVKTIAYNKKVEESKKTGTSLNEKKNPSTRNQKSSKNLPNTGAKISSFWIVVGLIILISTIYEMYRKYIME